MTPITGKQVALTGRLETMRRAEFRQLVKDSGATYIASLDESVDLLVLGGEMTVEVRVERARSLGIEMVTERAFLAMLGAAKVAGEPIATGVEEPLPLNIEALADARPSVAIEETFIRILDVPLARVAAGNLTPSLEAFEHYTLDGPTLQTLRFIARAVNLRMPCLRGSANASI